MATMDQEKLDQLADKYGDVQRKIMQFMLNRGVVNVSPSRRMQFSATVEVFFLRKIEIF